MSLKKVELYSINDNIKNTISFQIDNLADIPENTYINFRLKDYDVNIGGVPIPSLFDSSVDTFYPHVNASDIEFNILDADTLKFTLPVSVQPGPMESFIMTLLCLLKLS